MAASEQGTKNIPVIELDEAMEGNQIGTKNYRFAKIGDPIPITPDPSFNFDPQNLPSRPLAISLHSSLVFAAHSHGFCVARTKDVMEAAERIKEGKGGSSVQELSLLDVPIGNVSILDLSTDDSKLAVSIAADLHFFSVNHLLNKEQKPYFSCTLDDSSCIKDMRWTRKLEEHYVVLASNGKLYSGASQGPLEYLMDHVDAVEWSVKGNFVAVARKNVLNILSSKFKEKLTMWLTFKSLIGDSDVNCDIKVDSIRWVRSDCIIVGCFQLNDDGKEENYLVQVITSKDGKLTDVSSKPIVLSFNDIFLDFIGEAVPFASGPQMFLSYLPQCELAFIANRKNMDQHIVLFGWSLEGETNEAAIIEILNDTWLPRIDTQANGDDNSILGLSIDRVSHNENAKLFLGEEEKQVSPCCVLLCLTFDGKLTMFHFASAADPSVPSDEERLISDEEEDTSTVVPSECGISRISSGVRERSVEHVVSGLQLHEVNNNELNTGGGNKISADPSVPSDEESLISDVEEGTSTGVPSECVPSRTSSGVGEQSVEQVVSGLQFHEVNNYELNTGGSNKISVKTDHQPPAAKNSLTFTPLTNNKVHGESITRHQDMKPLLNSQISTGDEQKTVPAIKLNQDGYGQQSLHSGRLGSNLEQSSLKISHLEGSAPVIRDTFGKTENKKHVEVRSRSKSISGNFLTDVSSQSISTDIQQGLSMESLGNKGSTSLRSASSESLSSGNLISSKTSDGRSSFLPSSGVQRGQFGNAVTRMNFANYPGGPVRDSSSTKETAGSSTAVSRQGASTKAGNIKSLSDIGSSPVPLQENLLLGQSSNYKFKSNQENYRSASTTGLLNSDPNLSKQFRNVEEMAHELDTLLNCIEGAGGFKDASIAHQESSVAALEKGIWTLCDRTRMWRGMMDEQLREIEVLLDKTMKVLVRKLYMEGFVKQATDSRYWDLWNRQKLNAELELKQRRILDVNQDLTNQLIGLEKHFNTLEFNKFGETGGLQMKQRSLQSRHGPSRHIQSLHSLHNTTTAQLGAAEQLSECLAKQMAELSVESPSIRKENVKKKLFDTIGISYNSASCSYPVEEKAEDCPSNKKLFIPSNSTDANQQPRINQSSAVKGVGQETARRRRDSLDRSWASFEPSKTTVKRMLLPEDNQKVCENRSSLPMDKQHHNDQLTETSADTHAKEYRPSSTLFPSKSKDSHKIFTKRPSESPSTVFRWADGVSDSLQAIGSNSPAAQVLPKNRFSALTSQSAYQSTPIASHSGANQIGELSAGRSRVGATFIEKWDSSSGSKSRSIQQSEIHPNETPSLSMRFPPQTLTLKENSSEISNLNNKRTEPTKYTDENVKHRPLSTESSFESGKRPEIPFSHTLTVGSSPTPNLSGKVFHSELATSKIQPAEIFSSPSTSSPSMINSSTEPLFSFSKPTAPTSSSVITTNRLSTDSKPIVIANQSASLSQSSVSSSTIFSSQAPENLMPSYIDPPAKKLTPESPKTQSQPRVTKSSSKRDESSTTQASVTNFSLKTDENAITLVSPSQSKLPTGTFGLKLEPSVPLTTASELSTAFKAGRQLGFSGVLTPEADLVSNSKSEQPFVTPVLSTPISSSGNASGVKIESSDVSIIQEDEMEEEAPETSQTTELTLGNLGGFGIGAAPNLSTSKPNPFGVAFVNAAANPAGSPFTLTASSGELFRPASFNFQSPQLSQTSQPTNFGAFSTSGGFGNISQISSGSGFGQPAQLGAGQQALGSVLGVFGQSRQLGAGLPGSSVAPPSNFGSGFVGNNSPGGFVNSATGGGFASAATAGGGGFAPAASGGGGFAAAAATGGGGFGGAAAGGGFGAFSNQQGGSGGFSTFGGGAGAARPPSELFTQMRK